MGFFKAFQKKKAAGPPVDGFPELSTGMAIEVLTPTGVPLFRGPIRLLGSDTLEVRAGDGGFLPRAVYGQAVRLQGSQESGAGFTLEGSVGGSRPDLWRIERLRPLRSSQHRDSFRQQMGSDGRIYLTKSLTGQKRPCKVLDVSANGARVVAKALFKPEDVFYLMASLLPAEPSFFLPCRVKRVQSYSGAGGASRSFEYGCQFFDLPQKEQERLVEAVFTLQRETIRSRRPR